MNNETISWQQLAVLVTLVTMGDSVLVLFNIPAKYAAQDAWISGLVSIPIGMGILLFLSFFMSKFPGKNFLDIAQKVGGKWFGGIIVCFFFFYVFLSLSAHILELGSTMTTQVIPGTSEWILTIIFTFVIIFAARKGLEPIARSSEIFFPWVVGLFLFLSFALLKEIRIEYILPVYEYGWKPIVKGAIPFTSFTYMELVPFLMIVPLVKEGKSVKKGFLIGGLLGGSILFALMLLCILVLGPNISSRHFYTSYILAKKVSIGGFVERVDVIIGIIWIMTTYYKTVVYFYVLKRGIGQWLKVKNDNIISFPLGMIIVNTSIILSPNIIHYRTVIEQYWPFFDLSLSLAIPFILLFAGKARKIVV